MTDKINPLKSHEFVREAREHLRLSRQELANMLGVSVQTVGRWEADPTKFLSYARRPPKIFKRTIMWMLSPGRPKEWPRSPKSEKPTRPLELFISQEETS